MDLATIRSQTPGCTKRVHFNNAGASLMPQPVAQALRQHLERELEYGGYAAADAAAEDLADFYAAAAELVGGQPSEIAYMNSATESWQSLFMACELGPEDKVLTSSLEYSSNFLTMLHSGCQIELVEPTARAVEAKIDSSVKLICITQVPSQCGKISPAAEIGRVARKHGVRYIVDATQSLGHLPVNVQDLHCDGLCATGRKFLRGPRGTGFLWVSQDWLKDLRPARIDLHAAQWLAPRNYKLAESAQRFETWETSVMSKLGLGKALRYALSLGVEACWERIKELSQYARGRLSEIPHLELCDLGEQDSAIITLRSHDFDTTTLSSMLTGYGINHSTSSAASSRIDLEARGIDAIVRVSLHYYNTHKEIDRLIKACQAD